MKKLFALALLLCTVATLQAATLTVRLIPNPGEFPDIQSAVNASSPGDVIFITAGVYSLPLATNIYTPICRIPEGTSLTFQGEPGTIIDGDLLRRGFVYEYLGRACTASLPNDGIPATLSFTFLDLTIRNCQGEAESCASPPGSTSALGGGIEIFNDPDSDLDVTVQNCVFENNNTNDTNGANNNPRSASGGAIYINGRVGPFSVSGNSATVSIDNCSFTNNSCFQNYNGGHGGAAFVSFVNTCTLTNSNFCNNFVFSTGSDAGDLARDRNAGGAVHFHDRQNTVAHTYDIDNCIFAQNSATTQNACCSSGGAVFVGKGENPANTTNAVFTISNSQFYDNTIESGVIDHIDSNGGTLNTVGNTLANNVPADFDLTSCSFDTPPAPDCTDFPCGRNKVLMCHIPPGNPGNAHTICINVNAVQAHLAHGDYCGPCVNQLSPAPGNRNMVTDIHAEEHHVHLYPNPASNQLIVEGEFDSRATLVIYDISGKQALVEQLNSHREQIDISSLNKGLYMYEIQFAEGDNMTGKLVIE